MAGFTLLIWTVSSTLALAAGSNDTKCSYSIKSIQFGFLIKMTDFTEGLYTIAEKEGLFERKDNVSFSNKNSTHKIKPLKPCTEYKVIVRLIDVNDTKIICNKTEDTTKTTGMDPADIIKVSCPAGYPNHFCYQSGWDISSLSSKYVKASPPEFNGGSYHFKPAYENICSDFLLEYPTQNCTNYQSTAPQYVPVDFIDPKDINQHKPTKLPAKIEPKLPSSCNNLTVEYKCSGNNNKTVEPSDMKPFTDYVCTGDIRNNNVPINKTTPPVHFNIYCDFTIRDLKIIKIFNTSINLSWITMSDKCQDVLHNLDELSYSCDCQNSKYHGHYVAAEAKKKTKPDGGTCDIGGLEPYTDYRCKVRPIYNKEGPFMDRVVTIKTEPGIPDKPEVLKIEYPENNKILVKLSAKKFRGPDRKYIAELVGVPKTKKTQRHDEFEFQNLKYLTSYKIKVITYNGKLESESVEEEAKTLYNDKALIGCLVVLICAVAFLICGMAFFLRKRKRRQSRHAVNEEGLLAMTAVYANMPTPRCNQSDH